MLTNADMTVYNHYIAADRSEHWQRTEVLGVMWEDRKGVNIIRSGMLGADATVVYVPLVRGAMDPIAWGLQATKTGTWTLKSGDIVVRGIVTDELSAAFTVSDLQRKYDFVRKITTVDKYNMGSASLRHWRVGAS